ESADGEIRLRHHLQALGIRYPLPHVLEAALRESPRAVEERCHQIRRRRKKARALAVMRRAEDMRDLVRGDQSAAPEPRIRERGAVHRMADRAEIGHPDDHVVAW